MDYTSVCQLHDRSETDPRECAAWIIISIRKCIFLRAYTHINTHTHSHTPKRIPWFASALRNCPVHVGGVLLSILTISRVVD